ncbi:MAG TPA: SDR family NAD(P)-dependent oxidoreductase [Actinomycetota bacterium]|nr:SDR family NAD(P)-dependent oxidoreductase [Actinomycetota bacterium]
MSQGNGTALVTGAAGFIGSHVCDRLLAEGRRVVGVDDLSTGRIANLAEARSYGKEFTFENLDVRSEGLAAVFDHYRPDVVVHMAAQPSVIVSGQDPMFDADVNILGTINLLQAAVRTGARKLVYAASGGTLYGEPRRVPVKETALAGSRPLSPYGLSKKAAGEYLSLYQRYRALDHTQLALGNVYGPRQDPHGEAGVVAIFANRLMAGERCRINGDGNQTRDFVFVADAVDAFARAAERGSGRLINIGTGLETSINLLYRNLAEIVGVDEDPEYGPLPPGDVRRIALDPALAETELGWRPWTHLEDGLGETVAYLKGT